MDQIAGGPGLALEKGEGPARGRNLGPKHLDRDPALHGRLPTKIDFAEPADGQKFIDVESTAFELGAGLEDGDRSLRTYRMRCCRRGVARADPRPEA
jgi:hypothetical protein